MGSPLLEQLAFARFVESGDFARHLRRVRPIYRRRRDATIAALEEFMPAARWQGEAAGLHLWVELPAGTNAHEVVMGAYDRGVTVENGAWNWADPESAPPAIAVGYGSLAEPTIRRGIELIARALDDATAAPA
jgi:GntR family transcriptional regulator/MocR family aminotransferase